MNTLKKTIISQWKEYESLSVIEIDQEAEMIDFYSTLDMDHVRLPLSALAEIIQALADLKLEMVLEHAESVRARIAKVLGTDGGDPA